jgi:uncharacterized membrane protein YhaH (DUF805 family)
VPAILKFSGRRKRLSYFLTWLVLIAVVFAVYFVLGFIAGASNPTNPEAGMAAVQGIGALFTLPLAWPFYAVGAQRLHDMGYSGWFQLLTLIPLVNLVLFLVMIFAPTQQADNKYGPVPSGPYAPAAADARFAGS